ncbi:MAG: hypothetical protein HWE20_07620 [Gammaproteobacteria bacterium]|nr:hypothetical protein [Gammaproteobacteria bacterium]
MSLSYHLHPRAATHGAVGLLALAEDISIEHDLRHWLEDSTDLYTNRVACDAEISADTLAAMGQHLDNAVSLLPPGSPIDVVAYACTSGTMVLGVEAITQAVHRVHPNAQISTPLTAARRWLASQNANRLHVIAPYEPTLTQRVADAISNELCPLGSVLTFDCRHDPTVMRIDQQSFESAFASLTLQSGDAVFFACTALRTAPWLDALQAANPTVTISSSNHALAVEIKQFLQ